jgi:hypothetical protein
MALAVRNLGLLARNFGVGEVRRKLLPMRLTRWPAHQSAIAALNCRQLSLTSGRYCCHSGAGVTEQGRKERNKQEEGGREEVGSQEVGSQEVGRLGHVVTSMQLTYTCRVCSTRHVVETAIRKLTSFAMLYQNKFYVVGFMLCIFD